MNKSREKNGDHDRLQNKQRDEHVGAGITCNKQQYNISKPIVTLEK